MALPTSGLSNYASAVSQDDVCSGIYYLYRYTGQGKLAGAELIHTLSNDQGKGYGQNIINLSYAKRILMHHLIRHRGNSTTLVIALLLLSFDS